MKVQILQCDNQKWTPLGWLIKLVQRTPYSHYAIGFTSHTGEYLVLDATSKNVALRSSLHFLSTYNVVSETTLELKYSYEDFSSWYEPLLGESYGFFQLIGILLKSKKLGRGITCNELVLRMLNRFTWYNSNDMDIKDLNDTEAIVSEIQGL